MPPVIDVRGLDFRYPSVARRALDNVELTLEEGQRCILVGRNGAGKSTLLHVLAGKHMVPEDKVLVLGRPAFHDTSLAEEVTFLGGGFPFDVDVVVADILARTPRIDPARRDRLLTVLGVNPAWHMHRISDGQRRRVQLLLGLIRPARVLLLDEVTSDLDLLARADLLEFLKDEATRRGATILYATHVLDALDEWATHLAFLESGRLVRMTPMAALSELQDLRAFGVSGALYHVVERWLRDPELLAAFSG